MLHLILGGARSGKSQFAESLADNGLHPVTYIATCQNRGDDNELSERIERHQQRRPANWKLVEEPIALAAMLQKVAGQNQCILVDCLTLWVTNLLMHKDSNIAQQETQALTELLPLLPGDILFVSNETGLGITPLGELSRQFIDTMGDLHQSLAKICDAVTMVTAGLPLKLK